MPHLSEGTSERNRLWVHPVRTDEEDSRLGEAVRLSDEPEAMMRLVRSDGDHLLLHTDQDAPLGRVVRVDVSAGEDPPLAGKGADVVAAETADLLAFAAVHTGLVPSDPPSVS